jgi:hypothetical protein
LKELGVRQESIFYHQLHGVPFHSHVETKEQRDNKPAKDADRMVAAFTVAELGEMLGRTTSERLLRAYGDVMNVPGTRMIPPTGLQICLTRPDIPAKMLIYLIKNGLTTLD